MEIWDAYDNKFNKIDNVSLVRGEPIPDGMYHLVCDIIVKHVDETYLLMQRDFKKHFGGMWELTTGGSALKGEEPIDYAIRELKEETGIISNNLLEIARIVHDGHKSIYVEYLCVTDCDKDFISLQEGETINYKWVTKSFILEMKDNELASSKALKLMKELDIFGEKNNDW